ncbi:enoyl-ACP reductase FabI [Permianibacter aggregans]|uniref:Enoyl-[acyl-carrier-protein] reductase [NADH] n=1 Tax=Permianibacter aggregans TaxID=1510150 RepID=A0A4R6UNN3_9GAMM|nr:enoyl-ACP reductase [Permianibacter aggregans]QGX38950.1 enoyl-ACP reductase [Permianibacter aggregans]TDQ46805.1 enoyl-[acyl-carrier-protein] reductase [NADH] [Permianibacter aggregans]
MGFLSGKRALIVGLASDRSIAHGVAEAMHREGAELAFNYQNEKLKDRVINMAGELGSSIAYECDVASDDSITAFFDNIKKHWDKFDILVHSVAYAPGGQLEGDYLDCVTRDGFRIAHDISSYSFAAMAKVAREMMNPNGAMVTMTYLGAERALPNYNVMGVAKASLEANVRYMAASLGPRGIRVNAVSAGPIRTLAASGVKNFRKMLSYYEKACPLRRNVTTEDVGNVTAFLCSDLSSAVTGEVIHVDNGYHFVSMPELESAGE